MKNISHICMLIILLHMTKAEIRCKDSETHEEYILNPTDNENQLDNFISVTNEKLKYITEHLDKQCKDVHSKIPENCYEALINTHYTGIHEILVPAISSKPFKVFCDDDTHYGGWTVIARRLDGSIDFYRNWTDYKNGFGNLKGEFFIGLDTLHAMTSGDHKQELLIKLRDFNNTSKYAKYDEFEIGNETEFYALKTLGSYAGDAGDSLSRHVGYNFTTKDVDNSVYTIGRRNCAETYKGAWWFNQCYKSHLFGKYDNATIPGIGWNTLGKYHRMRYMEMLIRPIDTTTLTV